MSVEVINELRYLTNARLTKMSTRHGEEMQVIHQEMMSMEQLHMMEIDDLHKQYR